MMSFGSITLFGSGETLPASGIAYESIAQLLGEQPRISIIETPAGFQPNSPVVAGKVANFIQSRLQNYHPRVNIIPARQKAGVFSTNNDEILKPMFLSNWIFLGPGSPTYAVEHMQHSKLLKCLYAMHAMGCALTFSSACVLAMSALTLPVYEIYKVGEKLHWVEGLDFFARFGMKCVFIPHWNNNSGGAELDTRRCYMGINRFNQLKSQIPNTIPIIGIDEQTALTIFFSKQVIWKVTGIGTVTIHTGEESFTLPNGEYYPDDYGFSYNFEKPITPEIEKLITSINLYRTNNTKESPPENVIQLAEKRVLARENKEWQTADLLREEIESHGWEVQDTFNGYDLVRKIT